MSSKTQSSATKEEAKPALVPNLRFPEFRGTDVWMERKLSDITTAIFDGTHQTPTYVAEGVPFYSVENLVSGNANKFISRADYELATKKNKPEQGDVLITRIGKIGYSQIVSWSHDFSVYVTLAVIKKDDRFNSQFLHQFIQSNLYQTEILSKSLLNAVPCKINMDSLRGTRVFLASPAEQQKIAECLSSVDELIAAQVRKVDVLKIHKKGLMQQLFPREGETQPRLRFPEFQNAREWEMKAIGDVFKVTRGEVLAMTLVKEEPSSEMPYPVYSSQTKNKGLAGYYSDYLYQDAITWTTDGANAGDVNFRHGRFYCTNVCGVLLNTEGYANECIAALLNSVTRGHVSYVGNPKLMNGVMAKIEIPFSSIPEQQRIAECLSSLDAQITAETQKLEALKTHKKGLMQQLFPSPEVTA
jgi:type I restriction enzyme S subunit